MPGKKLVLRYLRYYKAFFLCGVRKVIILNMKVNFKSEGGFGFFPGLNKPVEIDSNELPADEAEHLEKLVDKAAFFDHPSVTPTPTRGADFKTYTITVENQGQQHKVEVNDINASSQIQDLLSYLRKKQKESRGK